MLEEKLISTNQPPAEVAQMLISYVNVELAAGGASSEARFFQFFPLLCQRVFGSISPKDQKHQIGGWLSRVVKWECPPTSIPKSLGSSQRKYTQKSSKRSDPVIKLLGVVTKIIASPKDKGPLTLIETFATEAEHRPNVRYQFPFLGLPKSTQEDWLIMIQIAAGGVGSNNREASENSIRLMGSLFRVELADQKQLLLYQQGKAPKKDQRRPLQLNPIFSPTPKSPMTAMNRDPSKEKDDSPPDVLLSMLEYYLMMFIRYPLAAPEIKDASSTSRRTEPYGESVYLELFQEYTKYYIPISVPQGSFNGFANVQRPSEIFVRIMIALWLEGQNQPLSTKEAIKLLQDRRGPISFDLNASYDLVFTKYNPLPNQLIRCIQKVVARVVSDGKIADLVKDIHQGYKGDPNILCMSPIMVIFQQPFYNHIRNVFRYASLHNKPHIFYSAFDNWLIWIEPWNTEYASKRIINTISRSHYNSTSRSIQVVQPKANHRSKYRPLWEGYIASNLHFYTVPLAIFLRRARELDFSPALYEKSLQIVQKVLRVYTPEVVSVINRLLKERETGCILPVSTSSSKMFVRMRKLHEENLGAFAPPTMTLSLSSCQDDMKNLLEEISLQHHKKVESLDFFTLSFASIFRSGAYQGEEKELHALTEKAKIVVNFPQDYEVMPQSKKYKLFDSQYTGHGTPDPNVEVSGNGRTQITDGTVKCSPEDIDFVGDKMMYAKPQSHEIPFLVRQFVKFSNFLNSLLGFQTTTVNDESSGQKGPYQVHCRINLRFLADYRNLFVLFPLIIIWLCRIILS